MPSPRSTARDLAQIAVFAALIAALGLPGTLYLGGNAVPITLQSLGPMLAGAMLGARKGGLAVLTFIALTTCGLPLLAGFRGGPGAVFAAPTSGYLWGWLLGAIVVGTLTKRLLPRYPLWLGILATAVGGVLCVYLIGIPWQAIRTETPLWTAIAGSGIYLPGDAIKVVVTALTAKQVHRAYPGLLAAPRRRQVPGGSDAGARAIADGAQTQHRAER